MSDGTLSGRRVLLTGSAGGIGAATARRLHEPGARVVLAGVESAKRMAGPARVAGTHL